ncbi:MAG: tetratricopeptide repeat protein [Blastocatellia bacterium]
MARSRKRKPQPAGESVASEPSGRPLSSKQARREKGRARASARKTERLILAGVLLVSALAFANSLDGQFVYDDRLQILKNPTLTTLTNIPKMFTQGVWQFLNEKDKSATGPYYRPLFNIALIVNYQLFGLGVFGWHVFSVAVHLGMVLLVYLLARRWDLSTEAAAGSALLFGLHPIHSESVAWISALPDPLAALFILSSLLLYERYYQRKASDPAVLVASVGLALLAMLSKEVAIVFPVFLLVREALIRSDGESLRQAVLRIASRAAPFFAAILLYLGMRYYVLGFLRRDEPTSLGIPLLQVLLTIPSVLLSYARMLFVPYPLAVMYENTYVQSAADVRFWGAGLAVGVLVGVAIWLVRSSQSGQRELAFLIVFLVPVLNLKAFRQEESLLHDRYLYLPSIGFCILVAMGLERLIARFAPAQREAFATVTLLLSVTLFGLTHYQNYSWQDELAMTGNALKVAPRWPFLHNYIGAYYSEQRNLAKAEQAYLDTIRIDPQYYDAYANLADVFREQGKLNDAEQAYLKSIQYGAPYAETRYNLGVTYIGEGRYEDATRALLGAVEIQPSHPNARYNLGWSYERLGNSALAEQAYVETLRHNPSFPEPRINLGVLLTTQGRYDEALTQLQAAQSYAPDHPICLYAIGDVFLKLKRYDDAIAQFTKLVRREPQHKLVYTGLGLCYEGLGRNADAKPHFEKAIEIAPREQYTGIARAHLARL